MSEKIKSFCNLIIGIISLIFLFFGVFVYTTEYKSIEKFLGDTFNFTISRLLFFLILLISIILIIKIIEYILGLKIIIKNSNNKIAELSKCNNTDYKSKITNHDNKIMQKIETTFNSANLKYYLNEYDLGNDFDNKVFQPLTFLSNNNEDLNLIFQNDELSKRKDLLLDAINKFLLYKGKYTVPTNYDTQALISWKNYDNDKLNHTELSNEFNELASDIFNKYEDLYKFYIKNKS